MAVFHSTRSIKEKTLLLPILFCVPRWPTLRVFPSNAFQRKRKFLHYIITVGWTVFFRLLTITMVKKHLHRKMKPAIHLTRKQRYGLT